MLDDADPVVRRRAAYVAGNLGLDKLAPALAAALRTAEDPADLRLAAYVALGELGMPGVVGDVVAAIRREDDPRVLGAASNALIAAAPEAAALAAPRRPRVAAAHGARRRACARPAPRSPACSAARSRPPRSRRSPRDDAPAVRGAAVWALGKLADPASEKALLAAFRDDDPAVHERAAAGLLRLGTPDALAQAIAFVAGDGDPAARGALAAAHPRSRPRTPSSSRPLVDAALAKVDADDPAFEPLVRIKLATPRAERRGRRRSTSTPRSRPRSRRSRSSTKLAGFDTLVKSLRTAESLFHTTGVDPTPICRRRSRCG